MQMILRGNLPFLVMRAVDKSSSSLFRFKNVSLHEGLGSVSRGFLVQLERYP